MNNTRPNIRNWLCPICERARLNGAHICTGCGKRICPVCRHQIERSDDYCNVCGIEIDTVLFAHEYGSLANADPRVSGTRPFYKFSILVPAESVVRFYNEHDMENGFPVINNGDIFCLIIVAGTPPYPVFVVRVTPEDLKKFKDIPPYPER